MRAVFHYTHTKEGSKQHSLGEIFHKSMKKKNREVSVFSVSALDLFCSAMGVFMILFFINMSQSKDAQAEATPALSLHLYLEMTEDDASQQNRLWEATTRHDVDMIISAKSPEESPPLLYSPGMGKISNDTGKRQHPNSPALYMTDGHKGQPDIWMHPQITPGNYQASFFVSERRPCDLSQRREETIRVYYTNRSADNNTERNQNTEPTTVRTSYDYVVRGYRVKLIAIENGRVIGAWAKEMSPSELQLSTSANLVNITVTPENISITPNEGVREVENPQNFLSSARF